MHRYGWLNCQFPDIKGLFHCGGQASNPPSHGCDVYIGSGVRFDTLYPEGINISNHSLITAGTTILSRYYNPETRIFELGGS